MKSVLISIQPKWVEKIASGKKTVEVRKSKPNLATPFKVYIYCTMGKIPKFIYNEKLEKESVYKRHPDIINGKVIGEFICDKIYNIKPYFDRPNLLTQYECGWEHGEEFHCLSFSEMNAYLLEDNGYGWHISDLKIYDKPKELSEFIKPFKYDGDGLICGTEKEINDIYEWDCETLFKNKYPNFDFENCKCEDCPKAKDFYRLTRPPQSWCYVETGERQ